MELNCFIDHMAEAGELADGMCDQNMSPTCSIVANRMASLSFRLLRWFV